MAVSWIHFATAYCGYLTVRPTLTNGGPPPLERNWLRYSVVTWSSVAICSGVQNFADSMPTPLPRRGLLPPVAVASRNYLRPGVLAAKAR